MSEQPARWTPAAARADDSPEELANATCALCGIELSIISLVPDGGPGSAEVRWYCRDIVSCTQRWTADRARPRGRAPAAANAPDLGAEPVPAEQVAPSGGTAPVAGDRADPGRGPGAGQGPRWAVRLGRTRGYGLGRGPRFAAGRPGTDRKGPAQVRTTR